MRYLLSGTPEDCVCCWKTIWFSNVVISDVTTSKNFSFSFYNPQFLSVLVYSYTQGNLGISVFGKLKLFVFGKLKQLLTRSLPATDACAYPPVLMLINDAVPNVHLTSPTSKQHCPNIAACASATCRKNIIVRRREKHKVLYIIVKEITIWF